MPAAAVAITRAAIVFFMTLLTSWAAGPGAALVGIGPRQGRRVEPLCAGAPVFAGTYESLRARHPARLVVRAGPAQEQLVRPEGRLVAHRRAAQDAVAEVDVRDA